MVPHNGIGYASASVRSYDVTRQTSRRNDFIGRSFGCGPRRGIERRWWYIDVHTAVGKTPVIYLTFCKGQGGNFMHSREGGNWWLITSSYWMSDFEQVS
jgi:hypothetical protein